MGRVVYFMFVSNGRISFHLRWGVDLVGHRGVLGCCGDDCVQNVILVFMSLLAAPVVGGSHIWAGVWGFLLVLGECLFWRGCLVLGYHSMGFGAFLIFPNFLRLSWFVPQLVVQLVYTMFISNNLASFRLWWNENLVKHQNYQNIMKMIVA